MMESCLVCGKAFTVRWTDTHGIAACCFCNTPYRIYHYDGVHRVEKPPECMFDPEWLPLCREYFSAKGLRIPNDFNIPGSSYDPCTDEDYDAAHEFIGAAVAEGRAPAPRPPSS
jgi:hypothetical protein